MSEAEHAIADTAKEPRDGGVKTGVVVGVAVRAVRTSDRVQSHGRAVDAAAVKFDRQPLQYKSL